MASEGFDWEQLALVRLARCDQMVDPFPIALPEGSDPGSVKRPPAKGLIYFAPCKYAIRLATSSVE